MLLRETVVIDRDTNCPHRRNVEEYYFEEFEAAKARYDAAVETETTISDGYENYLNTNSTHGYDYEVDIRLVSLTGEKMPDGIIRHESYFAYTV